MYVTSDVQENEIEPYIKDFISIFLNNGTLVFKFKKDKIAKYSTVSPDLKSDLEYVYIEKKLNL